MKLVDLAAPKVGHLEMLRSLSHIGVSVRLKPHEKLLSVKFDESTGKGSVLIETFVVREYRYKTVFAKRAIKMHGFTREKSRFTDRFYWTEVAEPIVMWDEAFVPIEDMHRWDAPIGKEVRDKREWERDAHRVGSSRNPMDNYDTTYELAATSEAPERMKKHWRVEL